MTESKKKAITSIFKEAGLYLIATAFLIVAFFFLKNKIKQEASLIVDEKIKIEKSKNFLDNLALLQKEEKEAQKYIKKLQTLLPKDISLLDLAYRLNYVAKKANVDFSFNFKKGAEKTIKIDFSLKGQKDSVLRFLELIRTAPFFLSIEKMQWQFEKNNSIGVVGSATIYLNKDISRQLLAPTKTTK